MTRITYTLYKEEPFSDIKCWSFTGRGLCNDAKYVYLGEGKTAYIGAVTATSVCPENGSIAKPFIDGKNLTSRQEDGIKSGTEIIERNSKTQQEWQNEGYIVEGGCSSPLPTCVQGKAFFLEVDSFEDIEVENNCIIVNGLSVCSDELCPAPDYKIEENPCPPGTCKIECCGETKCYTKDGIPIS